MFDLSSFKTINASVPKPGLSERYRFIPTTEPISVLASAGWMPVKASEARTRIEAKRGYQKHMIRFNHSDYTSSLNYKDSIPQIILTNDHSGGSSFEMLIGIFEVICTNGLIVCSTNLGRIRIPHLKYKNIDVEEGIKKLVSDIPQVMSEINKMKQIELNEKQKDEYLTKVVGIRWDKDKVAVRWKELGYNLHTEQSKDTLWNVFNVAQEHIIKGGVTQINHNGKQRRSRGIRSVKEDIRINKALWQTTVDFFHASSSITLEH